MTYTYDTMIKSLHMKTKVLVTVTKTEAVTVKEIETEKTAKESDSD